MKRRGFLRAIPAAAAGSCLLPALGSGVGVWLAGCQGEPASGPVSVNWDRETDPRCGMVISDRRFAAEIRDPEGKVWKFDDIGCAMFWLSQRAFNEATPRTEYWVADYRSGDWLDARQAYYLQGRKSPMGYHFAALAEPEAETLTYQEMKRRILARGK